MGILKDLKENQTLLLLVPNESYNKAVIDLAKEVSKENTCYVTLNKTFAAISEDFKKKGVSIDKMIFIDAISSSFSKSTCSGDHCFPISSPGALTELGIAISKFLKHGFGFFIFDSVTNLNTYHKKILIVKFITSVINKLKNTETKAIFIGMSGRNDDVIDEVSTLVDKVVDFSKQKVVKESSPKKVVKKVIPKKIIKK